MREITLPCGRCFTIDDSDVAIIQGMNLFSDRRGRTWYVRAKLPGAGQKKHYLHNLLMGGRSDHRDGDGLNNVRSNLRRCTQAQNGLNRAPKVGKQFNGVYRSRSGLFYAQIYLHRKATTEHGFTTAEAAARAYDRLAIQLHGEWAKLNFPL